MSLAEALKGRTPRKRTTPLWKGPCDNSEKGGVTFSMLNKFLNCRERFRLYAIEGLRPSDGFNHKIEYGNLWHTCEETWAETGKMASVLSALQTHAAKLAAKYRFQQDQVGHWHEVCKRQFPLYVEHWSKKENMPPEWQGKEPVTLMQEDVFCTPLSLKDGRVVYLKGKRDKVDQTTDSSIWMMEHKTKGEIEEEKIERQLTSDLQTMFYLIALMADPTVNEKTHGAFSKFPLKGVRYNVVRRPLSGGKGTIRQHQPSKSNPAGESKESFYNRVAEYIREDPKHYFMRWEVAVSAKDISEFQRKVLQNILIQLCEWYDWINKATRESTDPFSNPIHWQHPYGVRNMLDEGRTTEYDLFLRDGNEVGLVRSEALFEELGL